MKKIQLMHITHDLAIGGLQQVVVNLCQAADRQVFDVSVLCLRTVGAFGDDVLKLGVPVILVPQKKNGSDYFSFLKVRKILQEKGIEVIHTHNTQPFVDGTLGALFTGVKTIVHTDHARDFPDKRRYMFAEWLVSQKAYKVVGVSTHTTENLRNYEKITRRKLLTIPNGVSLERFSIDIDREALRRELGVPKNGKIIGLGVRLSEQKGLTYLLKAMQTVAEDIPDLSLVIAGDGPLRADLEKEANCLGISKNVFFVGPRTDMPRLIKLFDAYVLPSLWEGLPMVLLEAMAAGCPIIATDVGGNGTAVQDGVNGFLVPPRSPEKLTEAILKIVLNADLSEKFVRKSREIFVEKFSAEIMTKKYELLYQRKSFLS